MKSTSAEMPAGYDGLSADLKARSGAGLLLRALLTGVGIGSAALFVVIGLEYRLQLYADGSMFSYSVAAQAAWAFHWHNIAPRMFVYLIAELPAETYVALTHDPRGGVFLYGLIFFSAQLIGLALTWVLDRSKQHIIFAYACASTACLCPLVFGFPTEMWVAHALFWPTLSICLFGRRGIAAVALTFAMMLALLLSHEGAVILAAVIVSAVALEGIKSTAFLRATGCFLGALALWLAVKLTLPPDSYDGPVMQRAALHFFDVAVFTSYLLFLLFIALFAYGILFFALRRLLPASAHLIAAALIACGLIVYWLLIDRALYAEQRYYARTVVFLLTVPLGALAAAYALRAERRLKLPLRPLQRALSFLAADVTLRAVTGAVAIVILVHAVETAKFVEAWRQYLAAVRSLAMSGSSDPALGDDRFVSSDRINAQLNRLSWFSTTPYLSALLAPGLAPSRLVVDPSGNYFWLSCATATANENAKRAVPVETRRLVRVYACLHRP